MTERGIKLRETFRKKYGVDHPSQLSSVKDKIKQKRLQGAYKNASIKTKNTLLKKYGNENYVNVEKAKHTKMVRYGNSSYNNREKMLQTNREKYGMNVSPNTQKSTIYRTSNGEIGFKSEKYKAFLNAYGVNNISQLSKVKEGKKHKQISKTIELIFRGPRLKGKVLPLFKETEYHGADYNHIYKFKCVACNNIFEDNLYSGNIPRCLKCYPHNQFHSRIEDEIIDFIHSIGISDIQKHDRTILNGNEIDIFIPSQNVGIECDGIIWHSEIFGKKDRNYHLQKTISCDHIRLLHIWDWEWLNKQCIIKSIIKNALHKSSRIFARNCQVVEVSNAEKQQFLGHTHIQGDDKSSIRLGLIHDGILVSCMTFSKSRYDKKYDYELSRFCNKLDTFVIGASSKLFSYFIKTRRPKSIISYCNRRFFTGQVYEKIGMTKCMDTPPSYFYFHKNNCIPINRIQFQKHKLKDVLKSYDPELTEWQNMQLNGYDRIWDCGHFKYEWVMPMI